MKRLLPLALLLSLLPACTEEKNGPTAPTPPADGLIATATIDAAGGSLAGGDFRMTIPAGAFTATATLELYALSDSTVMSDHALTGVYEVRGIPEEVREALAIDLRFDGEPVDDNYLAVGREVFLPLTGGYSMIYDYVSAADSAGAFRSLLPPAGGFWPCGGSGRPAAEEPPATGSLRFVGLTGFTAATAADGRFNILHPSDLTYAVTDLVAMLNAGDEILARTTPGYGPQVTVAVLIQPIPDATGPFVFLCSPLVQPVIVIAERALSDPVLPRQIGATLFHLYNGAALQIGSCDPRATDHAWLALALVNWSETLFAGGPDAIPACFPGSELAPLATGGIDIETDDFVELAVHGRGMSPLIQYLVDQAPDSTGFVRRLLDRMLLEPVADHLGALLETVDDPASTWWPAFLRAYVGGEIFDVASETLLPGAAASWTIAGPADTLAELATTEERFRDLSARLYRITPAWEGIDSTATLRLLGTSADLSPADIPLMLFGYRGGQASLVQQASGTLTRGDLASLSAAYDELLVIAANARADETGTLGEARLDLDAELFTANLPYLLTEVHFRIPGGLTTSGGDSTAFVVEDLLGFGLPGDPPLEGGARGYTFFAQDSMSGTRRSVRAVLDRSGMWITHLSVRHTNRLQFGSQNEEERFELEAVNIPVSVKLELQVRYTSQGAANCSRITSLVYRHDDYRAGTWEELVDYACDASALIDVQLKVCDCPGD